MDLVEIRKKANSKKKKPVLEKEQVSAEVFEQQEQTPIDEPVVEEPSVEPEVEETVTATPDEEPIAAAEPVVEAVSSGIANESVEDDEVDPLDALFSFQQESSHSFSENYLQALVAEDEVVEGNIEQWLTFSLGNEEYALSIESVSEIIKPREVTDIPRVPDFISGIISLRGIIVPVFDLNRRLNLGSAEMGSASRIIVCKDNERFAGFIVDSINQVVNVPVDKIEPPPTVLSGLDRDFVEGVGRVEDRMLILLHLSNVINAELV